MRRERVEWERWRNAAIFVVVLGGGYFDEGGCIRVKTRNSD